MENQEVLDNMKTETTQTSDVVAITFGYSTDFTYESVIGFAKQFPTYQTKGDGKEQKHGVVFQLVNYEIATVAIKMWQLVEDWEISTLKINKQAETLDTLMSCREKLSKTVSTQESTKNDNEATVEEPDWAVDPPGVVVETLVAQPNAVALNTLPSVTDAASNVQMQQNIAMQDLSIQSVPAETTNSQVVNVNPLNSTQAIPVPTEQAIVSQMEPATAAATEQQVFLTENIEIPTPVIEDAIVANAVIPDAVVSDPVVPNALSNTDGTPSVQTPTASIPIVSTPLASNPENLNGYAVVPETQLAANPLPIEPITKTSTINNLTEPQSISSSQNPDALLAPVQDLNTQNLNDEHNVEEKVTAPTRPASVPPMPTAETLDLTGPNAFIPSNVAAKQVTSPEFPRPLAEPITEPVIETDTTPIIDTQNIADANNLRLEQLMTPQPATTNAVTEQHLQQQPIPNNAVSEGVFAQNQESLETNSFQNDASTPDSFVQTQGLQENTTHSTIDIAGDPQIPTQVSEATVVTNSVQHSPVQSPDFTLSESINPVSNSAITPLTDTSVRETATQDNMQVNTEESSNNVVNPLNAASVVAGGVVASGITGVAALGGLGRQGLNGIQGIQSDVQNSVQNVMAQNTIQSVVQSTQDNTANVANALQSVALEPQTYLEPQTTLEPQGIDGIHPNAFAKPIEAVIPEVLLESQQNTSAEDITNSQLQQTQALTTPALGVETIQTPTEQTEQIASVQENPQPPNLITPNNGLDIPTSDFAALTNDTALHAEEAQLASTSQNLEETVTTDAYSNDIDSEDREAEFSFSKISIGRFPNGTKEPLADISSNKPVEDESDLHREIDIGIGELPTSMQNGTEQPLQDAIEEVLNADSENLGLKTVIDERDAKPIWRKLLGGNGGKN